jgi:hypothetical protein
MLSEDTASRNVSTFATRHRDLSFFIKYITNCQKKCSLRFRCNACEEFGEMSLCEHISDISGSIIATLK